ncbi:MAG: NUDIX domain-containing protein, partial [Neisseriaceae bacterium]|nr:NUDIX domain-containing protein [Neisseriaceae bacterium]
VSHPQAQLLLEKRPDQGIWGGLYCVPTFDSLASLESHMIALGLDFADFTEQTPLTHRLTHFQLIITPFAFHSPKVLPESPPNLWATAETLGNIGMPKPLLNYLKQYR